MEKLEIKNLVILSLEDNPKNPGYINMVLQILAPCDNAAELFDEGTVHISADKLRNTLYCTSTYSYVQVPP